LGEAGGITVCGLVFAHLITPLVMFAPLAVMLGGLVALTQPPIVREQSLPLTAKLPFTIEQLIVQWQNIPPMELDRELESLRTQFPHELERIERVNEKMEAALVRLHDEIREAFDELKKAYRDVDEKTQFRTQYRKLKKTEILHFSYAELIRFRESIQALTQEINQASDQEVQQFMTLVNRVI